jgi:NADPH2:quinone reductase
MKAIQATENGGYDALHFVDIPNPQLQAGQALVQVTSAGVTPLDHLVLAGCFPAVNVVTVVSGTVSADGNAGTALSGEVPPPLNQSDFGTGR